MSGFDQYREKRGRRATGCQWCGGKAEGRVVVTLQERREVEGRTSKDANRWTYPAINSSSISLCETCAVQSFETALKGLSRP